MNGVELEEESRRAAPSTSMPRLATCDAKSSSDQLSLLAPVHPVLLPHDYTHMWFVSLLAATSGAYRARLPAADHSPATPFYYASRFAVPLTSLACACKSCAQAP